MAKYYIKCGSLELIWSTNKKPYKAVCVAIHEMTEDDELDEYIYIDQRGMKDYTNADQLTSVIPTEKILRREGYIK